MARWLALVGLLALGTLGGLAYLKLRVPDPRDATAEALAHQQKTLKPLFAAPAFSYVDHRGESVTNQSLENKVWVANFIFTTCRTICPLLTARMVQLQRALNSVEVTFVSFSVDPEHDTPQVLAAYAKRWAADEPRWKLLATDVKTLPSVAAGFHVTAEKNKPGELDPIIHSSVFVLVDQRGMVRGVYDSEQRADVKALEVAVRALLHASPPTGQTQALSALELYHSESCATCHEDPALAPSLFGRSGERVTFENGISVPFDAAYVKESLLAPDARRAKGYPLRMPSYDHLTAEGVQLLTQFVLEARGVGLDAGADVSVQVDPVCHMQVRATADALSAEFEGRRVFFCSKHCQARFRATPSAFPSSAR